MCIPCLAVIWWHSVHRWGQKPKYKWLQSITLLFCQRWQFQPANTSKVDYALGPFTRKGLCVWTLLELHEVLQTFCLKLGCQHAHGKFYLSSGLLPSSPLIGTCNNYSICNRFWHKYFILVYWCSVIAFFIEWLMAPAKLPYRINFKVHISLILMSSAYWKETIFDKGTSGMSSSSVDSLFSALAASGILFIQNTTNGLVWNVGQQAPVGVVHANVGQKLLKSNF